MIGYVLCLLVAGTIKNDETKVKINIKRNICFSLKKKMTYTFIMQTIRTLALIKPDAMQANHKEDIIQKIKEHGFVIVKEDQIQLSKIKAGLFYKEHVGKPFYEELTKWMSRYVVDGSFIVFR